jgi:hypothetical protein
MMIVAVSESASGLERATGDVASQAASDVASQAEEDDVEGKVS